MEKAIRNLAYAIVLAAIILGASIYAHGFFIQNTGDFEMKISGANILKINKRTGQIYVFWVNEKANKKVWTEITEGNLRPRTLEDIEREVGLIPEE